MEADEFWALIGVRRTDDDLAALADELATRDTATITAFEDRLAELLYALDTPAHAKAARARNDWFLYVRCAAVAAGREAYEQVLAEPAKLRRFARREAEHLLTVAQTAYERSTGRLWEHETPLSYESGSNTAAWGDPPPEVPAREALPGVWLTASAVVLTDHGYGEHVHRLGHAIAQDPAWAAWWAASGIAHCELQLADPEFGGEAGVRAGATRVEARAVASLGGPQAAAADVTRLLDAVRVKLDLGPLPPLPEPSDELPPGFGSDLDDLRPMGLLRSLLFVWRARKASRRGV
ncbi:DUF4240 domain-containing protein [Nucisporomicrobium flavum]|uniref:DUF4240 domain-containing protein n=1 Tax=Nucisporomicrobium flavum TaxID=2785915 RepID=UPI003C2D72A2